VFGIVSLQGLEALAGTEQPGLDGPSWIASTLAISVPEGLRIRGTRMSVLSAA
jgi:hypothetical protein